MNQTNELNALLSLLDDPDPVVYDTVRKKLLSFGTDILPNLEELWRQMPNEKTIDRVEAIMNEVHYVQLEERLAIWSSGGAKSIKEAYMMICMYRFQNLQLDDLRATIKKIYQSAWLEITSYLSPVEQLNVLAGVVHSMYKLRMAEDTKNSANYYFLNYLLSSKLGNVQSLAAVYLILSELLDIPIKCVKLADQVMLAYFDEVYSFMNPLGDPEVRILFYIDPANGMLYTQTDVDAYLKKMNLPLDESVKEPMQNEDVIIRYLKAILTAYESDDLINEKEKEILNLIDVIQNNRNIKSENGNK
jgi:regulator of sirC expression with transglutaminase-like and TPR domain